MFEYVKNVLPFNLIQNRSKKKKNAEKNIPKT